MLGGFDQIAPVLLVMAVIVAMNFYFAPSRGVRHSAFTFTFFGLVFLLTGMLGYAIQKSGGIPYLHSVAGMVWPQVWLGIACAMAALVLWRRALTTV